MPGTLFLVGTPIGNMEDVSDRARRVLRSVDLVAAEDTRRAGRFLKALGIQARLVSFYEAAESRRIPRLMRSLEQGADVALISDAGMPGVSDPGYRLVAACVAAGIPVDVVPGPSAALAALVVSGLPTDRFVFEGFLPRSGRARSDRLRALAREARTIVLFESPRRLAATIADLLAALGDRRLAVARELTKLHQQVLRGRASEVLAQLAGREVRGEVVVVLEGGSREADGSSEGEPAVAIARRLVGEGAPKRHAARRAAALTGAPVRPIYEALIRPPAEGPSVPATGPTGGQRVAGSVPEGAGPREEARELP